MVVPKICGIETEYGIIVRGAEGTNPVSASSTLVNAYVESLARSDAPSQPPPVRWDFEDESPGNDARGHVTRATYAPEVETHLVNAVLVNGSRYYVDHAHPELATPECRTALDVLRYDLAGEQILIESMAQARGWLAPDLEIVVYKNNSDGKGQSYGCHENYLLDRSLPFGQLVTAATAHSHMPLDMQLYLPQSWLQSASLRRLARIPDAAQFQTKPQIALAMLAQSLQPCMASAVVLADAAYGDGEPFRQGVRALGLHYGVGIHLATRVQLLHNDLETLSVQALLERLPARAFRRYRWRDNSGKKLSARFAFFAVRVPEGSDDSRQWLILERRDGAVREVRAHLSSLPDWIGRRRLVYLLKERFRTEAAYRELKQELGLDQYEGRRYTGLQHHLTVVMCAYAFVVAERDRAFPPCAANAPLRAQSIAAAAA